MTRDVLEMVAMGLLTSLVAPAAVILTRVRLRSLMERANLPVLVIGPAFVAAHSAMTVWMGIGHDPHGVVGESLHSAAHAALFIGAMAFWMPVIGPRPISGPGRTVYLFVSAPTLDLAAVVVVAAGHSAAGLAMIVSMLPLGLAAVWVAWRWVSQEEHAATIGPAAAVAEAP